VETLVARREEYHHVFIGSSFVVGGLVTREREKSRWTIIFEGSEIEFQSAPWSLGAANYGGGRRKPRCRDSRCI